MAQPRSAKSDRPAAAPSRPATSSAGALASLLDPQEPFLLPLLVLLVTRVVFTRLVPFAAEDAYITFRYAKHFASGLGLVYNPGEHVMGFSSPLWTLWSAVGFALHLQPETWTRLSSIVLDAFGLFAMVTLLKRHAGAMSAWAFGLFYASWPFFAAAAVSGMECNAFVDVLALAALAIEGGSVLAGPAMAAVVFLRPEGVLVVAPLLLLAANRDRLIALGLVVLGAAGLTLVYGSPIPQSVVAKAMVYGHPGPWQGRYWWEWLSPSPLGRWPQVAEGNFLIPFGAILAPALIAGLVALWRMRRTVLAAVVAGMLALYLAYIVVGTTFFWWYLVMPLAGIAAAASVGLPRIVQGRAIPIALIALLAGMWTLQPDLYRGRTQTEYDSFMRTANVLSANAEPGQSLMLEPIGIVGYSLMGERPVRIIDEVGLVSPEVSRRRRQGPGWYSDLVAEKHPDWLAVRRSTLENQLGFAGTGVPFRNQAERDSLIAHYTKVAMVDSLSGENAILVLRRAR